VVFGVDALGAWLVEQLADAGRKKLTALVLGDDQKRALSQAAKAAVRDTAAEMSPSDGERAAQLATEISRVFRKPMPDAPLAGVVTLLEGLQAGITRQLAVLDDAGPAGTGQSAADVLGVPRTLLADTLTSHLVREIMFRGSRSGPLTPLADQLNHELTRLQGQRVEGMLARLLDEARGVLVRPDSDTAAGRPLGEVTDPFALEVHRPVQPDDPQPGLPVLPIYVPREHDTELGRVARAAAEGSSGIAVLVGESSTGKTRGCWEMLQLLRDLPEQWRLWHPIDPSRTDAALRELPGIGPRTVVWLNEAQYYLDVADGGLGERVAAGLRELLRDPARAPVLVLATLWPQYWDGLTARPPGGDDPHAQARELLAGHDITVPAAFTAAQLQRLGQAGDVRLARAAVVAQDGQVTQFLAGVPELIARYRNAPPAAKALIHAAMDARRLGMRPGLPQAFLNAAAPGYLTGAEWDALGGDWLEQALAYMAVPSKGVRGPLTPVRPRPARSRTIGPGSEDGDEQLAGGPIGVSAGPLYRLADYLDQHGRRHREGLFPPAGFWAAAADHVSPSDQAVLGDAADARGLYRDAAQLHKNAAARGNLRAVYYLSTTPRYLRGDVRPALWAAAHASLDDPAAVAALLGRLREAGAEQQTTALLHRDLAAHVCLDNPLAVAGLLSRLREAAAEPQVIALADRAAAHAPVRDPLAVAGLPSRLREVGADQQATALADRAAAHALLRDPFAVATLLGRLREAGADQQAAALLHRDLAAHVCLDDPRAVARLLASLRETGAEQQATALADRAAAHVPLDDPRAVAGLREAGGEQQATALADRAAALVSFDDPFAVVRLLGRLREAGEEEQATALAHRAAALVSLDDPFAVAWLLGCLWEAGEEEPATVLLHRDLAAHVSLDNPLAVAGLLGRLREAGAEQQATALARRAAAHFPLDDPAAVARLLGRLREAGEQEQATALADRAAAHAPLHDPDAIAGLLSSLREAGAEQQVTALLHRDLAAHVSLDSPRAVARLLASLREAGAEQQATALADRAAAHFPLDSPRAVARLLASLREAGADQQATALADRAAAHVSLDNPRAVATLLASLREAGAEQQATALAERLPGAGMFELFHEQQDRQDRFRFGREADGSPAPSWGWEDLD